MEKINLKFGFEARYYQEGSLNAETENLIFVLHGHGQQAKYFIRKFSPWFNKKNCVVAPEGLSRYYLEGFSGRVGATWMTKEDRLTDIKNYLSYLNSIFNSLSTLMDKTTKIHLLGFSQGAATVSRWAANEDMYFDQLILWAGIFPPDMDFKFASSKFKNKKISYVYGSEDPFLNEDRIDEMRSLSDKLKIRPEVFKFRGAHDIDPPTLGRLI